MSLILPLHRDDPEGFKQQFQQGMLQLSDPVLTIALDPLVAGARDFAKVIPGGGPDIVGLIESQIIRAPANKKYPMVILVDAICRVRSDFKFSDHFSQKLETILPFIYREADDIGKAKILKLIGVWRSQKRFDPVLLDRVLARIDPDYRGPPLESLPQATLPSLPQTVAPALTPNPPMITPSFNFQVAAVPPTYPPIQPSAEIVFARAADLLTAMYTQLRTPVEQRLPLHILYSANPAFYSQLLGQAHQDVLKTQQYHQHQQNVPVQKYFPANTAIAAPVAETPVVLAAPKKLELSKLNAQSAIDTSAIPQLALLLVEQGKVPKRTVKDNKQINVRRDNSIFVRPWLLGEEDWCKGINQMSSQTAQLFQTSGGGADAVPTHPSDLDEDSCVPKDPSQTHCALTGEEFETVWNPEEQMWMYKSAVRPDPNGKIYKVHAWLASQRGHSKQTASEAIPELGNIKKRLRVE